LQSIFKEEEKLKKTMRLVALALNPLGNQLKAGPLRAKQRQKG
jgi:hypothetical protein